MYNEDIHIRYAHRTLPSDSSVLNFISGVHASHRVKARVKDNL